MNYYNYFTEIEEHFVRRRGKHLLISPSDWSLIAAWRDAGVPLNVAIRGIDIAMDGFFARQKQGHAKINSLCYCHDSVMAEYASHLESHVGESTEESQPGAAAQVQEDVLDTERVLEYICRRIDEIKAFLSKHSSKNASEGVIRVLARMEEIRHTLEANGRYETETLERDLSIIDDLLTAELQSAATGEQLDEWGKEARKELKIYKKRLPKETYEKIRSNFMRERLHRHFGIGELSLFHL